MCIVKAIVKRSKCLHDTCRNSFISLLVYWFKDAMMLFAHISFMPYSDTIFYVFLSYFSKQRMFYYYRLMNLLCCFLYNAYYVRKSSSFLGMHATSVIQSPWENGWEKTYWRVRLPSLFYQNDIDKLVGRRYSLLMHLQYCRIFYRIFVKSKRLGPMTFLYRVCLAWLQCP